MIQLNCLVCKKTIKRQPSQVRYHKRHVCSIACRHKLTASNKGKNNGNWRGGRIIKNGYIAIRVPEHPFNRHGYVFEHRLIMEKKIGRKLNPKDVIHHINGIMTDNREENLMLTQKSIHHRIHGKKQTYWKNRKRNNLGHFI